MLWRWLHIRWPERLTESWPLDCSRYFATDHLSVPIWTSPDGSWTVDGEDIQIGWGDLDGWSR